MSIMAYFPDKYATVTTCIFCENEGIEFWSGVERPTTRGMQISGVIANLIFVLSALQNTFGLLDKRSGHYVQK